MARRKGRRRRRRGRLRVVFDASVIVSAALKPDGASRRALVHALEPGCWLFLSRAIEAEYCEVLARPKFDRYASAERRRNFLRGILDAASWAEPELVVQDCDDPKDNIYLELAATIRADVIVSGDARHLLVMDGWRGVRIINPTGFLAMSL